MSCRIPHKGPSAPGRLLDVKALAAMLDCSPRTVHRLRASGTMPPPVKVGRLARWDRTTIEAWIATGCRPVREEVGHE